MTVPCYQSLMLPLMSRAAEAIRPVSIRELRARIAGDLGLSPEQLAERSTNSREGTFHNRLHWAKQYLTRAGLLEPTCRGYFQLTDEGRALLATKPATVNNKTLQRYPAFVAWRYRHRARQ